MGGTGSPPPIWCHSVTAPTPGLPHLTLPLSCHSEELTSSCHTTLSIAISFPYVVFIYIFRHPSLLFLVCTTFLAHVLSSWFSLPLLSFPPMSLSLSLPCSSLSFDLPPLLLLHLLNMHSPQFSPSPPLPPSSHSITPSPPSLPLLPSLPPPKVLESKKSLMKHVISALQGEEFGMKVAALKCILFWSRSPQQLRTTLIDYEVWRPLQEVCGIRGRGHH